MGIAIEIEPPQQKEGPERPKPGKAQDAIPLFRDALKDRAKPVAKGDDADPRQGRIDHGAGKPEGEGAAFMQQPPERGEGAEVG